MTLTVLLPFAVFAERPEVSRIVVETGHGSCGILPHRLDCVAALTPGILVYETSEEGEVYVAVDEGVGGHEISNSKLQRRGNIAGGLKLGKLRK